MDKYLIKYLRDTAESKLSSKYIDFFKIELDWHIYNSETHVAQSYHRNKTIGLKVQLFHLLQYSNALFSRHKQADANDLNVLSAVYFSSNNTLSDLGFNSFSPVWQGVGRHNIFGDFKTIQWHRKVQNLIRNEDFYLFLDSKLHQELENFQDYLLTQYQKQDFRALLLNTDQYFYSKYSIEIFKKLDRPSFVFSHGLPALYSLDAENRSDYLLVWSEKIKQNYCNVGFDASKIKVIGNPKYTNISVKELRSSLTDILVIPVSSVSCHQHEYDNTVLTDQSMVVLYLYKVQTVLKKLRVKKARYRVHPSINKKWVHAFLDQDFYVCDNEVLSVSLNRSSLVIGATSTVLLESLIHGVNYIGFEPKDEFGIGMVNFKTVTPFDGSEEKLMVANDEMELEKMVRNNAITDYSLVHDYMQDFDLTILKELIK